MTGVAAAEGRITEGHRAKQSLRNRRTQYDSVIKGEPY